jgi:hypothetical protein
MIRKPFVRAIPALSPQGRSEDRRAPQSWHVQVARGGGEARARSAVLQAALRLMNTLPLMQQME